MLKNIISIAEEAGKIISEGFHTEKNVNFKGEVDLVTEYDVATEKFLIAELSKLFPNHEIVAEESSEAYAEHSEDAIYIDPIDGTTNFVHGVPFVATSIGVYTGGECQYGVVYNPILNEMHYAEKGKGAFLNGKPLAVSKTDSVVKALIATGFPYDKKLEKIIPMINSALLNGRDIRRLGAAALDLCYVARGVFDVYYETTLNPWDAAAGMLIVREAGGVTLNFKGEQHDLKTDDVFATNKLLEKDFLTLLKEIYK